MNNRSFVFAVIFFAAALPCMCEAQIPNAGFEQWTAGEPEGWITSNAPGVAVPITQSATSRSGLLALRGEISLGFHPPIVQAGPNGAGFTVSQRHSALTGFYQFLPIISNELVITVTMLRERRSIGGGVVAIKEASTSYTPFTVELGYLTEETPDTCMIRITIIGPMAGTSQPGSTMLIDDLSFSDDVLTSTENENAATPIPKRFVIEQNRPNPFNASTEIGFSLFSPAKVKLAIYNQLGQEVALLEDRQLVSGRYDRKWNPVGLVNGVYFYRLYVDGFVETKKLILLKQ
jgi:hypothetical protein